MGFIKFDAFLGKFYIKCQKMIQVTQSHLPNGGDHGIGAQNIDKPFVLMVGDEKAELCFEAFIPSSQTYSERL